MANLQFIGQFRRGYSLAHRTPNFMNPEFQLSQFKVLQTYWHFWVYFDNNLELLSGKTLKK